MFALIFGSAGIFICFTLYGIFAEKVTKFKEPVEDGKKFKYPAILSFSEALINLVLSLIGAMIMEEFPAVLQTPLVQGGYAKSGAPQLGAKFLTNFAMTAGVSFALATLAKSSKMVPVMIGQIILGGATYTMDAYARVGLIVAGSVLVGMAEKKEESKGGEKGNSLKGLFLLALALACDGFVAGVQKKLKTDFKAEGIKLTPFVMQSNTNLYMALTAFLLIFVFSEFKDGFAFIRRNKLEGDILKFALCSFAGQAFIFYTIANFDPLYTSTVTTMRKIFSVVYSIAFVGKTKFGNPILGWFGVALAGVGIVLEFTEKLGGK